MDTNQLERAGEFEEAAAGRSSFTGRKAPDFALANQNDQVVSLGDLRGGWVVLYFYPKNDTPGCTCQATEFTELLTAFKDMNARVIGISHDSTALHRHFIQKYDLKLELLSDPDHQVMSRYGAYATTRYGEQVTGRVIRSTVVIDPTGRIAAHYPEVIPDGHAERMRERLARLQQNNAK